jgi:RNA polymerase sigma-70 factor (ECF subfamily)
MTDPDAVLVAQCQGGNPRAFEVLMVRYERQVFGVVFRILHHREDAIDVTQAAFLQVYEHLDRYDPGQRFLSWLNRIAVNQALDLVRGRRPSEELSDDTPGDRAGPDWLAAQGESDTILQAALMGLKIEYRTVLVLKHVQECSYEEIAQILNCPVKTVKSRLFTARQALRDVLVARGQLGHL